VRILAACWLGICLRGLVVLGLVGMLVALIDLAQWETLYESILALIALVFGIHVALVLTLRCLTCHRRFLIDQGRTKHPGATRRPHLDYWGSTVLDILQRREFTCMYCGTRCCLSRGNPRVGGERS
jgi:hypothetical protein